MDELKILYLEWLDSSATCGWTELVNLEQNLRPSHAAGILVHENSEQYVLASAFDKETESANAIMVIPKACVLKVKELWKIKTK